MSSSLLRPWAAGDGDERTAVIGPHIASRVGFARGRAVGPGRETFLERVAKTLRVGYVASMQRIQEGGAVPSLPNGAVVTVGTFDGVHLGHEAVLAEVRRLADELGCPAVVITFDR